jgi:hypothetical protein
MCFHTKNTEKWTFISPPFPSLLLTHFLTVLSVTRTCQRSQERRWRKRSRSEGQCPIYWHCTNNVKSANFQTYNAWLHKVYEIHKEYNFHLSPPPTFWQYWGLKSGSLYHLSHTPSPFGFSCFLNWVLHFYPGWPWTAKLLFVPPG